MDEEKDQPKPDQPQEPKYIFPEVPAGNAGAFHVDRETNIFWVGVKVEELDYAGACAFLESAKYQFYCIYRDAIRAMRAAEALMPQPAQMGQRAIMPPSKEQFAAGLRGFLSRKGK